MNQLATTRLSSKGQVVIPEQIRERLGLKTGVEFVVICGKGVVILKAISAPEMSEFDDLVAEARRAAKTAGLRKADVAKAVARSRKKR